MSRVFRWLLLLLLIAVIALAGIAYTAVRRPFPQTDGVIEIPGLQDEVRVLRDEWGVPHIYASNEHDLFLAQGYVHAQDRFWQMEFWRHTGQGRLSEIVGESTVETDRFIRTVGWNRIAEETIIMYQEQFPEYYAVLEAYSAGVNAYLAEHGEAFSISQSVLGLVAEPWEIEPWEPLDTVSWAVVMSWDLSGNMSAEQSRAGLTRQLGRAKAEQLQPPYPNNRPVIVDKDELEAVQAQGPLPALDWARVDTSPPPGMPGNGFALGSGPFVGSNNWVVSGKHTDSGLPLLANDPHLGIQMPAIWYEVGLHGPDQNVVGLSFAGAPGVVVGHNDKIAWGVTNVGPDVQDLYVEKINPDNPNQVEFKGEWEDMTLIEETVRVNGGEDVRFTVRVTRHGPIINETAMNDDPTLDPLALKWATSEPSTILASIIQLNRAEDFDDFRQALRYWDVAPQNLIYADVEGNIGYQMPGRIPIRAQGDGSVPVPGWTGEYEWEGWIPYDELPRAYNPEKGYIVTANNAVVDDSYPYLITTGWANGDRAQRIVDMIEAVIAERSISADDFARIQLDSKSLLAQSYLPLLNGLQSDDARLQAAIERLRGWDMQERRDSVPAALFEIFFMHFARNTIGDEMGGIDDNRTDSAVSYIFFHELANQPDAAWWDDVSTDAVETQRDIILKSLEQTIGWFEENVGGEMQAWTWGELHTATFVSNPLGASGNGVLESLVNRGPYPADGGSSIARLGGRCIEDGCDFWGRGGLIITR
jgi:penicillin amidase